MSDYLKRLKEARQQGYTVGLNEGLLKGLQIGVNLCTIGFNRACGIGRKRIKEAEVEVNKLIDEIVKVNDPDWTTAQIQRILDKIK